MAAYGALREAMPPTDAAFLSWLSTRHPLDVYALGVAAVMLVLAAALLLASRQTDRRALRLFALRYALGAAAWTFAHPRVQGAPADAPFVSMLAAVALLALTIWALDEFLGCATSRRRMATLAASVLAVAALAGYKVLAPASALGIYVVMGLMMSWCAATAWRAAAHEPGVGHRIVALAFASYPALLLGVWPLGGLSRTSDLAYLVAVPGVIVGVTVLVVSLARSNRRLALELDRREQAEAALRELNATLEEQVASRTASMRTLLEGMEMFTRSVSHDLRGSLGGATALARLVRDALAVGDWQRAQRLIDPLPHALGHTFDLVQGLLELSRLEERPLERRLVGLRDAAQRAADALAMDPQTAPLMQRVSLQLDALPQAHADAVLMQQVFANLIGNAVRFASAGTRDQPRVEVGAAPHEGAQAVYVRDNGPGFDPAQSGELFKPFARLHDARLSQHGIGLSIVRRIVERHGGRIWAESTPGDGAVFWFTVRQAA